MSLHGHPQVVGKGKMREKMPCFEVADFVMFNKLSRYYFVPDDSQHLQFPGKIKMQKNDGGTQRSWRCQQNF